MKKDEKDVVVAELQQRLDGASAFYLTDFTGLSVKQITQFRARLRKEGVEYVVVKNTLAKRAIAGLEIPDVAGFFNGPTGVVIGRNDAAAAAKVITDFAKEFGDRPAIKVGVVGSQAFDAVQVRQLANLPSREVLLSQIAGGLQQPMARLAGGMNQLIAGFARAVDQLRQQKEEASA